MDTRAADVNPFEVTQVRIHWREFVMIVMPIGFTKSRKFLEQLNNYQVFNELV
jgi:hypothetical protein